MSKKFKFIFLLIFINISSIHSDEYLEKWFSSMSGQFIGIIESENNEQLFEDLRLLINKNFAINSISLSLIGRLVNKNSVNDLDRYKKAFLDHLTRNLYELVENYDGQTIELEKIEEDTNGYLIYSILKYKEKSYSIVWRVGMIENIPYVLDIIIENSSYYVTKKSEFSNLLRQSKGSLIELTNKLEEGNNR
jgi:ABC-type transporter MlaC component|tara:strand:- start:312 stop:887 length:576 start_codon:yes stop_codon:yes gene_type:complete